MMKKLLVKYRQFFLIHRKVFYINFTKPANILYLLLIRC